MTDIQGRFVWYELLTSDTAGAKSFYGHVVGWTMQDMPMAMADAATGETYTILQAEGAERGMGGLMAIPAEARGMPPAWVGYLWADDVDAMTRKAESLGGKIYRQPADIPGVGRFSVVADPLGASFCLFKASMANDGGAFPPPGLPGHVGWRELHSSDWPAAFAFYDAMFGWQKADAMDMGPMGSYQLFVSGDDQMGGMFNSPAAGHARFWLYYFNVADIDAAAARVTDSGGKILHGPAQVPGGDWIVQGQDPQGAHFALVGKRG